jgi:hypothetical protein
MAQSPFIIASALLFWSWQTGLWQLGIPLAVLAELPTFLTGYWELSLKERQRIADLCSVGLALNLGYVYITQPPFGNAVILTAQWLPVIIFPLLATQIYGNSKGVELSVLFLSLRNNRPGGNELINLRPIYLITCLLAAGMLPPVNSNFYYVILSVITLWALLAVHRPDRTHFTWLLNFSIALIIGFVISLGLTKLQAELEEYIITWLSDQYIDDAETYTTTTAIGDVGRLKLSEQVMLRVWPDNPLLINPLLLRSASFNNYLNGTWVAKRMEFSPVYFTSQNWILSDKVTPTNWVKIAMELEMGNGVLPLPNGSCLIQGLKGAQLSSNVFGTVKIAEGADFASYKVDYGKVDYGVEHFKNNLPLSIDLRVPGQEQLTLANIVTNLNLHAENPTQTLNKIRSFFQRQFKYSLDLTPAPLGQSSLTHFLTITKSGHCEYFASAAVLLLRQAGIPARYVQGWSIQEYSELEQAYIARARHAHAWALVWINGAWQDFDPTPSMWSRLEAENSPWWSSIQDLWGWLRYQLAIQNEHEQGTNWWLIASLIVLVFILIWRIAKHGKRVANVRLVTNTEMNATTIFTPIEQILSASARARFKGETLLNWLKNLSESNKLDISELLPLLHLYYRQRFDPAGLNAVEIEKLQQGIKQWLK